MAFLRVRRGGKLRVLLFALAALNVTAWSSLFLISTAGTVIGIGALAYFFGLKHAFDADHIAAIDNVTRKLRQDGKRPIGVGFFFSLGHSTVVILLSLVLIFAVRQTQGQFEFLKSWGGLFGTVVSASFLVLIGVINLVIFSRIRNVFNKYRKGGELDAESVDDSINDILDKRGFISGILGFVYKKIDHSWKMYPIGLLFGLGFDTATEVAILGMSAMMAQKNQMPLWQIMIFPLLFMAGMTLMDSLDGIAMMKIYDWAMVDVLRKLFFNMTITGASVFIALVIGLIEWLQIMAVRFGLNGAFWNFLQNMNFEVLGVVIVFLIVAVWLFAYVYYRRVINVKPTE